MNLGGLFLLCFFAFGAVATPLKVSKNCKVTSLDEALNPFEEGLALSSDDDADDDAKVIDFDVSVKDKKKQNQVGIGTASFWAQFGDKVDAAVSPRGVWTIVAKPKGGKFVLTLKLYNTNKGNVLYRETEKDHNQLLAAFDCN